MEEPCLQVTAQQLADHMPDLMELIEGVRAYFVFNINEMDHQDWANRHRKPCFVSAAHERRYVYFPVHYLGKRITLIACIARDGSFLKPMVIVPRKTVDDDLLLTDLTSEKVDVISQPRGDSSTATFNPGEKKSPNTLTRDR
jgi:hypothetical protein